MTQPVSSVGVLADRIASIEARVGIADAAEGGLKVLGTAAEFDPFGAAYDAALEAAEAQRQTFAMNSMTAGPLQLTSALAGGSYCGAPGRAATTGGPSTAQISAAIAGMAGPAGVRAPGGYGPMPVPSEIAIYANGQVPDYALQPLTSQPNHRLASPAAAAWDSLVSAAAADGITMRITDSYRDYAEQVDLAARKGLYSQGGLAATPGRSNHGWGLAVDADVTDPATLQWLRVNGPRFGFVETSDREPWHWEFRPHQV